MFKNLNLYKICLALLVCFQVNSGFTAPIDAGTLINSSEGFSLLGANIKSGQSVSHAGDFNGDGISDMIIGAPKDRAVLNGTSTESGFAYIVFGKAGGYSSVQLELDSLNGTNGFALQGEAANIETGYQVSYAGDINNDGFSDVIVANRSGVTGITFEKVYVVFGTNAALPAVMQLSELNGANGFSISPLTTGVFFGSSVSHAGDINNDGIDDIIIGASHADGETANSGVSYVIFGKSSPFSATFDLTTLNGSNGFVIHGENSDDRLGAFVSGLGDVNGDGIDELSVGATLVDTDATDVGATYVVFGSSAGFGSVFNVSSLDGNNGFVITGLNESDAVGRATGGDVNGDGFSDVVMGAPFYDSNLAPDRGVVYVVFGKGSGFTSSFDLSTLDGNNGFTITGPNSAGARFGISLSSKGDTNGDGVDDIFIGVPGEDSSNGGSSGAAQVVYGRNNGFPPLLNVNNLPDSEGFSIIGAEPANRLGTSVSFAGDVNNDGIDDVIVGAPEAGDSYVVYGKVLCLPDGSVYSISNPAYLNGVIECANQEPMTDTLEFATDITLDKAISVSDLFGDTGTNIITSSIVFDGKGFMLQRNSASCNLDGVKDNGEFRLLRVSGSNSDVVIRNLVLKNGCADGPLLNDNAGGAIFADGDLELDNTLFSNNKARYLGGGLNIANSGTVSISNSIFENNKATEANTGSGGAIYVAGTINSLSNTLFRNNDAMENGGAISVFGGTVSGIESSTFESNTAKSGAAVYTNNAGTVTSITNSTFSQNFASGTNKGAILNNGTLTSVRHSTFVGNSVAIENANSGNVVVVLQSLFATNLFGDCVSATNAFAGSSNLSNLDSIASDNCPNPITPILDVNSVRGLEDNGCVTPLADGSCVPTHGLKPGSQAINALNSSVVTVDQRGFNRTGNIDVGAYETFLPTLVAPGDLTVEATGPTTVVALGIVIANDPDQTSLPTTLDQPGPYSVGVHNITWSATDRDGNTVTDVQVLTVQDTTGPEISLNGGNPLFVEKDSTYNEPGATAMDLVDGDVSASIVISGTVNTSTIGDYQVNYKAVDSRGNETQVTRMVKVHAVDSIAPVITLNGDNPMILAQGETYVEPGAVATDNIEGDISQNIVITGTADVNTIGDYQIHYNISDTSGNAATEVVRIVLVRDIIFRNGFERD